MYSDEDFFIFLDLKKNFVEIELYLSSNISY